MAGGAQSGELDYLQLLNYLKHAYTRTSNVRRSPPAPPVRRSIRDAVGERRG